MKPRVKLIRLRNIIKMAREVLYGLRYYRNYLCKNILPTSAR